MEVTNASAAPHHRAALHDRAVERRVGFAVLDRGGIPVRSSKNRRAVLYQHAGHARRFADEHRSSIKTIIVRCVINPADETATMLGYVILASDGNPVRIGPARNSTVRLLSTSGGSQRAAERNNARAHRVFIG